MDKREIDINHQVQYRKYKGKTQFYANDTKTNAGKRIIPMTEDVYKMFVEQKKVWLKTTKDASFEVDL